MMIDIFFLTLSLALKAPPVIVRKFSIASG